MGLFVSNAFELPSSSQEFLFFFFFFFPVLKDTSLYNAEVLPNLLLQLTLNYLLLLILEKHTNRKFIFISYNK